MIKAVGHRVLVRRLALEERDEVFKSAKNSGLLLPDHEDIRRREAGVDRGIVVDVGPDAWKAFHHNSNPQGGEFIPWAKVGDLIAFAKYSGMVLKDGDQEFIMINDEDVVAYLGDGE